MWRWRFARSPPPAIHLYFVLPDICIGIAMPYLLRAVFELGLPVAALSWLLFYRLYSRGELARDADRKALSLGLKRIKRASKTKDAPSDSLLHKKWMKLGGGFYGVAALWTLLVMETGGIVKAIVHPSSIENWFRDGVVEFIINWVVGQFTTFMQAFLWFSWWPDGRHEMFGWVAVALVGYLAGTRLARYETTFGSRLIDWHWRTQLRSWWSRREGG